MPATEQQFGLAPVGQLTCGCQVHVSVESEAEEVAAFDRIRVLGLVVQDAIRQTLL